MTELSAMSLWRRFLDFFGVVTQAPTVTESSADYRKVAKARWDNYACFAGTYFQDCIAQNTAATRRLHQFLYEHVQLDDQKDMQLMLRVWLNEEGKVVKLILPEWNSPLAELSLRQILTKEALPFLPPSNMPMPLLLRLRVMEHQSGVINEE